MDGGVEERSPIKSLLPPLWEFLDFVRIHYFWNLAIIYFYWGDFYMSISTLFEGSILSCSMSSSALKIAPTAN